MAVTSRAEAQTMRLACIYALLDKSDVVREEAPQSCCGFVEVLPSFSTIHLWDRDRDPVADAILQGLRIRQPASTGRRISSLFKRHRSTEDFPSLDSAAWTRACESRPAIAGHQWEAA